MLKLFSFLFLVSLLSCEGKSKKDKLLFENQEDYEQTMIHSHQEFLKLEKQKIESFIDSSNLTFKATGTGLRFSIYELTEGENITTGDIAVVKYILKSLKGEVFYESPENRSQEFMVDYDNVESGLHEGIKQMRVGEKALFILPAHLAHGITGDQAAIPSQTTLVYDLHLLRKK